jgi:hypothetical protein
VLRRDLAPSLPQPRFGIEPAGQDPGQTITPGRRHYRSVRSRMPVLSATIFHAVFVGAGFGTCRLGADNRLVAGSSPPSPTTQSRRNGSFHETAKKVRQFRSLAGHGALSPVSLSGLRGLLRADPGSC